MSKISLTISPEGIEMSASAGMQVFQKAKERMETEMHPSEQPKEPTPPQPTPAPAPSTTEKGATLASPPPGLDAFTPEGWKKYFEYLWYASFDLWLEEMQE